MKNNREEGQAKRKLRQPSASTMQTSARAGAIAKEGEKQKGRPGKLSHSVTAGQQK